MERTIDTEVSCKISKVFTDKDRQRRLYQDEDEAVMKNPHLPMTELRLGKCMLPLNKSTLLGVLKGVHVISYHHLLHAILSHRPIVLFAQMHILITDYWSYRQTDVCRSINETCYMHVMLKTWKSNVITSQWPTISLDDRRLSGIFWPLPTHKENIYIIFNLTINFSLAFAMLH